MVDKLAKQIMSYKKDIGEFSLDMYYNDLADEKHCYVAKLKFLPSGEHLHFRDASFVDALLSVLHHIITSIRPD